jgi:DNA-binding NarL/FixJ family response regulator
VAEPISLLIADDHEHIRAGPRPACRRPDIAVVGEAGTGEQVVALAARLQPDVVLMDLQMPGPGGVEATTRVLHTSPHMRVVVVSMFDGDSVFAALQAGGRGYLLKGAQGRGPAVHPRGRQRRGDPRPDHRHQADALPRCAPSGPAWTDSHDVFPELTEREQEILVLVASTTPTPRSPAACTSVPRRCATTPPTSSPSCTSSPAQAIMRAREAGLG